jgi:hypothetical protein
VDKKAFGVHLDEGLGTQLTVPGRIAFMTSSFERYHRETECSLKTLGNQPGVYFWRLPNGKAPQTFHAYPHNTKWWLLELIPIELRGK